MSPAQQRFTMEQKDDACSSSSSLYKEIDDKSEVAADTNRYPTRSQPKTSIKSAAETVPMRTAANRKLKRKFKEEIEQENNCDKASSTFSQAVQGKTTESNRNEHNTKGGTCPKCQKMFQDLHSLTLHVKEHNTDDTICGICSKKLSSASSLDRHMLTHTGEKPFQCKYCPQCFTTNGNMNRHKNTHELEIASRSSGPKANKLSSEKKPGSTLTVLKKELGHKPMEVKLSVQEERATTPPGRKRLKITPGGESSEMPKVPAALETSRQLAAMGAMIVECREKQNTLEAKKLPNSSKDTEKVTEESPLKVENQKNRSQDHELKIVTGFEDLTNIAFSSPKFGLVAKKACEETIRLPYFASELVYKCRLCDRFFPCDVALKMHGAFHDSPSSSVCHYCHCHFESPKLLEEHKMKYHRNSTENHNIGNVGFMAALGLRQLHRGLLVDPQDAIGSSSYVCYAGSKDCQGSDYKTRLTLSQEKKCASKEKNDEDDDPKSFCMAVLKPVAEDRNSLQEESAVENADICGINLRVNADTSKLESSGSSNVQSSHQESSNDFADISSIISNLAVPSSEGSSSKAPLSGSGSETDNYSLQNYIKGYKKKGYKGKSTLTKVKQPIDCTRCDYKTLEKSSLMRHMLTHDKERPFKCTKCGMTFTTKSNGERHAKTIHRLTKSELITVIDYNLSASNSNKLQKMCKYCYNLFENNRALQHHLRSKTNNCKKKPFICRECRMGFSTKNNCHRHITNLHKELLQQAKTDVFIIVNRYLKSLARKNKLRSAKVDEAAISVGESSNSNTSSYVSATSPTQQSFQQQSEDSDVDSSNSETSSSMLEQNTEQQTSVEESFSYATSSSVAPSPKHKQITEQEMEASIEESSNSEFSTSESPSPILHQNLEVQYYFSDDERVKAAESLVSLSEGLDISRGFESGVEQSGIENTPLDLSIRAIDLTERSNSSLAERYNVGNSGFNGSISMALLTSPNPPTSKNPELPMLEFAAPLNLSKKRNNLNTSSIHQNTSTPITIPSNNQLQPSTSKYHFSLPIPQPKTSKPEVLHECIYCNQKFTQKSNKDRHIRNLHPEYAKPRKNKNFLSSHHSKKASKQAFSTLSSATREALLTRVLQHTDENKQLHFESDHSVNLAIKEETIPAEEGMNSDLENVDLASVSSVINTANSPKFTQYLMEDCNTFGKNTLDESSSEPPRKKPKASKPQSGRLPFCDYCKRDFNDNSSLKRHLVTHSGEKNFKCPFCTLYFGTNSNMVRHVINIHKLRPPRRSVRSPSGKVTTSAIPATSNGSTESAFHELEPKRDQIPISSNQSALHELETKRDQIPISSNQSALHELEPKRDLIPISLNQSAWPTSFVNTVDNSNGNTRSVLNGFKSEQAFGTELCVSPATRREYPEPNRSPDLPETSPAVIPSASESLTGPALECTFCNTSYKTEADRWNHMKQLHPLEYGKMQGKHINLPDIVSIWKKNGCAKLKR